MVKVHVFNGQGELVGPIDAPKLELSDAQWQARLSRSQFEVLRAKGTERPFCGTLLDNKTAGVYTCAGCGLPLFASDSKFNSGTGWPSFFRPISDTNVIDERDSSHGMIRDEILCARCDGHLGHVFDDGPRPTGLRYCLNSESLAFTPSTELAKLADPAAEQNLSVKNAPGQVSASGDAKSGANDASPATETAVLAGGCFWCTEAVFLELDGVLSVTSGYTGGTKATANYQAICSGATDHAEAISITYDPKRISFDKLLDVFFDSHDPTQLNRQGNDVGRQYRSAIFYANNKQKEQAVAKIRQLKDDPNHPKRIVTTLEPLETFYPAEQYHQNYAAEHPEQPYIQMAAMPKVCKIRDKHADLLRKS